MSRWRAEWVVYLLSALSAAVSTVGALQLWRADLSVPFVYWGDAVAVGSHFKTVIQTGWYEFQPLLGAPAGQSYHDFPTADNLNFVAARVLGWFTTDFGVAMNAYYLAGFVLAALAMTWFLRESGVSRTMTVVMAALFALAPYHFARGEGHLWLASYFTVPLALVVVLRAARGERLWRTEPGQRRVLGLVSKRGLSTATCLALVATASTYYALFVVILLATAGVSAWWRDRNLSRMVGAGVAGAVLVLVVLVNMAPDILYAREHGSGAAGLVREQAQVEIYALKLSQLLLPVPGHRIGSLASIRSYYDSAFPLISENPSLGAVAAFGLVCCLVIMVLAIVRPAVAGALRRDQVDRTQTLALLAMLTLVAFLCSTVGGFATLLSFLTSSLRGWNRMSIVIAALCLAAAALVLDALLAKVVLARRYRRGPARAVAGAVALLVLLGGLYDQTTPGVVPDYAGSAAAFASDRDWIETVESALPVDAMVFQLPYAAFPESAPVNGVFDSEQLKPYLHSSTLRWSGGGVKGRATSDWPRAAAQMDPASMVTALSAEGFAAIMVDRRALGPSAADLEVALSTEAGRPVEQSVDSRYALYSLGDEVDEVKELNDPAAVAEVAEALIAPVMAYPGADSVVAATIAGMAEGPEQVVAAGEVAWVSGPTGGSVTLDNGRDQPVRVRLHATLSTAQEGSVDVSGPELSVQVPIVGGTGSLDTVFEAPPGRTTLRVSAIASVTVTGFTVTELDLPALQR